MKQLLIAVAIWIVSASAYAGMSDVVSMEKIKEDIAKLMKTLRFELKQYKSLQFCEAFLKDFQAQKKITYVQPVVRSNSYKTRVMLSYQEKCPKLEPHKHVEFLPGVLDAIQELPEDKRDQAGHVFYGTQNFKWYRVDINNDKADGDEYVFYSERFFSMREKSASGWGEYVGIDLAGCKFAGYHVSVDTSRSVTNDAPGYNDVIHYKGLFYIFDLAPSTPGNYILSLSQYLKETKRMDPVCQFYTGLQKAGQ